MHVARPCRNDKETNVILSEEVMISCKYDRQANTTSPKDCTVMSKEKRDKYGYAQRMYDAIKMTERRL
jgi:hypothetical protein